MLTREEFNKAFGQAIKAARKAQGLSRAELAERMRQHPVDPEWSCVGWPPSARLLSIYGSRKS